MPETLNLNYYYGNEADQYSFYRIPKILLTDRRYKGISLEAKVLYGLLLDRMGLSARNGWLDDNGRVFLYFTQEEAMTMLDCGKDKATKLFRELEGIGLMERKKQGKGHPARIYVKNFILEPEPSAPVQTAENQQSRPLDSAAVKTAEKPQSAPLKTSSQECGISVPNNTEINKTEKSDTDLSIPPPTPSAASFPAGKRAPRRMGLDEMENYRELILENIDYDILLERNPWDKDLLDGYVELMLEICCSTRESVRICGQEVPTEVVKSRFLKLKVPVGVLCATQHRINESAVLTLVSDMLRAIAEYSRNDRAEFIKAVQETQAEQQASDITRKRKRLAAAQKRAGELEKLICKIYEDNVLGKLPDARYAALDAQYAKEQESLSGEIAELEKAIAGYEQSRKSAEKFIALVDKYENFDSLTTTMLNEFVEKILVHERDRKGSIETTQEVEIYFNFVGRYIPPHFREVNLTPEELDALRKKEERKDKLHQAYLRRKANGTQKRYEDKIKAKKKSEIEAKKAAIRAEDMENGVFIPASSLPKKEPQKAPMPARAAM